MTMSEGEKAVVLNYTPIDDAQKAAIPRIKTLIAAAFDEIVRLEAEFGRQRDYSLAKTHLQEASMWAVRGITNPERGG